MIRENGGKIELREERKIGENLEIRMNDLKMKSENRKNKKEEESEWRNIKGMNGRIKRRERGNMKEILK